MEHLGTKELETKRLLLRKFTLNDVDAVFKNWVNDNDVTKFLTWKTHNNKEITKNILEDWIQKYTENNFYLWAIVLKEINEPIGTISIVRSSDKIKMVEFGYCIGKSWWKKGITSEALNECIKYFFEEVGINRIEAKFVKENENSGKVMIKCGMTYEGLMRQDHLCNYGLSDTKHYAILAEDYFTKMKI